MKNIVLIGFMGTGKTAVGKALAVKLGEKFVDIDNVIVEREKMPVTEIFSKKGEQYFRDVEAAAVRDISKDGNQVIACGGGVALRQENIDNLKKAGVLVCLTASADTILKRTKRHSHRPLLNVEDPKKKIEELLDARAPYYKKCDHSVDTTNKTIEQVALEILEIASSSSSADSSQ